jgi:ribosomal protein L11 methylase PrmA
MGTLLSPSQECHPFYPSSLSHDLVVSARKRWFILSGLFVKDAEEIEGRLNQRSIKTYLRLQEKNWMTLVGLNWGSKV